MATRVLMGILLLSAQLAAAQSSPSSQPASAPTSSAVAQSAAPAPGLAEEPVLTPTDVKLRALEERVNELKEKIFRSKARLVLLQEAVLHGTISGARAVLVHKNEMGGSFRIEQIQYALDGALIFNKVDTEGGLDARDEFEIFNGSIVPGNHQISVYLVYRGNGFGVFSYLNDYKFKIKSSYTVVAEEGKQTTVRIVGFEKGGVTTDLKDRPAVRYDVEVQQELRNEPQEGAASAPVK